jgi:hypothetical protein
VAGETIAITNKLYDPDQVLTLTATASEQHRPQFRRRTTASEAP